MKVAASAAFGERQAFVVHLGEDQGTGRSSFAVITEAMQVPAATAALLAPFAREARFLIVGYEHQPRTPPAACHARGSEIPRLLEVVDDPSAWGVTR